MPEQRSQQMRADISRMTENKLVEVEIRLLPRRSDSQLRYYWAVVVALVNDALRELGHDITTEDTHAFLKDKFNPKQVVNAEGELIGQIGGSTGDMTTSDMAVYIEEIQRWASQSLGIYIPDPNEQTTLNL